MSTKHILIHSHRAPVEHFTDEDWDMWLREFDEVYSVSWDDVMNMPKHFKMLYEQVMRSMNDPLDSEYVFYIVTKDNVYWAADEKRKEDMHPDMIRFYGATEMVKKNKYSHLLMHHNGMMADGPTMLRVLLFWKYLTVNTMVPGNDERWPTEKFHMRHFSGWLMQQDIKYQSASFIE